MSTNEALRRVPWWVIVFILILFLFVLFTWTKLPSRVSRLRHVYFSDLRVPR